MKKNLIVLFLFLAVSILNAQWVVLPFDTSANAPFFMTGSFSNGPTAEMAFQNNTDDKVEGEASLQVDYRIEAFDGWGGFLVRVHRTDSSNSASMYYDLSEGTELKLRYKIPALANMSKDGIINLEWKLIEQAPWQTDRDLWFHLTTADFSVAGDWVEITMPLEQTDDNTVGFAAQFADGDGELQLEYIIGFEIALVYLTEGSASDPPTAEGTVLFDALELSGNRYEPITSFDDTAEGFFETLDWMEWAGDGAGSIALSNNAADMVEGAASLQLDYTVNASQDWGGYINMYKDITVPEDFAERTTLTIFVKNSVPHQAASTERLTFRFFLIENSTGTNEDWVCDIPITFTEETGWVRYRLPLVQTEIDTSGGGLKFASDGFAQPWWNPQGDQVFNPENVIQWKMELSAAGNEAGPQGETFTGQLLFDIMQQGGFQSADDEAPAAPTGVASIPGTYSNLVTWADVPGEDLEKYSVYYSDMPITDVNSPDVEVVASDLGEGIQVIEHVLIAPSTDQEVTYYYAITCKDVAGNVSEAGLSGAVTNTAKGVTTISLVPPVNFAADGELGEWAGIRPFRMFPSDGSGTIHTNTFIDSDEDCSAEAYVAIDAANKMMYVAFNVNDDVIGHNPDIETYGNDSPDLFIGLYDQRGPKHVAYRRGSEPDYHLRFNMDLAREDHWDAETDSLLVAGTADYYWGEKFPAGYVVEARISFDALANKRDNPSNVTDTIPELKEGFRIPIDFSINDNDGNGAPEPWVAREGLLFYSSSNQDQGWEKPWSWTNTWLGDLWEPTSVNDGFAPVEFSLEQNYPNPFNPTTQIDYSISKAGTVKLAVFDVLGRKVADLVNDQKQAGKHSVMFNASQLSTGVYFYRIESGSFVSVKKMILVK